MKSTEISAPWGWGLLFLLAAFIVWSIAILLTTDSTTATHVTWVLASCLIAICLGVMVILHKRTQESRRLVDQELAESEERTKSVIMTMNEGVILQDADGKTLTANAHAEKLLGLTVDKMQAKTLVNPAWRTIYQDGSPFPHDMLPHVLTLRNGKPCTDVILGIQKPKDELIWLRIDTQPLRRPREKKTVGVVASLVDITDQKRAEESLQHQSQIFDEIQDAVVVTDLDGRVKLWNKGAEHIFGYSATEAIGSDAATLYSLEDEEVLKKQTSASLKEKRGPATEVWAHRKSGERCFIHLSLSLLRKQHGTPYGMVFYASDITELKRVEEALRESEAHMRLIVDTAMDAVITMDAGGRISGWNAQALATFGWSAHEITGKTLTETIIPPEHREAHTRGLSHYLATGEAKILNRRVEMNAQRKNGETFPVEVAVTAILNPNGPVTFSAFLRDISVRKQAEENLRHSEERYRTLIERMNDGLYRSTPDGKFIEVNPAMVKMLGYTSKKELMDIDIKTQLYFDVKEREEMVDVLREIGKEESEVFRLRHKDGHEVWVEDHGRLVYDAQGNVLYHEGILRNITARLKAEKDLRDSEKRYRTLVERMTDGVYRSTPDGKFIEVNAALVKMLGYASKSELMEIDIKTQLYFDVKEREKMVDVLRETGKDEIEVFRLRRKDGNEVWVEDHGRLVYDAHGAVLFHEGILRDITARLQVEKALHESEERYRTLYDDNPFMYFTVDANGIVLSVNRFGAEQLGFKIEELLGKPVVDVFHEEDKALASKQLKVCLNNSQTVHHWELRKRRKDGSVLWVRETARATHDADNRKIVIIVCEDISERKRA